MKRNGVLNGKDRNIVFGTIAGMAGGLAASWVMNLFIEGVTQAKEKIKEPEPPTAAEQAGNKDSGEEPEDATQKVADAFVYSSTGEHLSKEKKKKAGPAVHYAFGSLMGAVYGAVAEYSPASRIGLGTLFGTALFVAADEIAVPALGLGDPPTQVPMSDQAIHLAAHWVYGATTELVRRGCRSLM